jgi:hypothetical protein
MMPGRRTFIATRTTWSTHNKKTVLELSKSLPAVGMAENINFETWGCKFVDDVVSESIFVESNLFNKFS